MRDHEESGQLEVAYGVTDVSFMAKNFNDLVKECSMVNAKGFGDVYQLSCASAHDDMFNVSSILLKMLRFFCYVRWDSCQVVCFSMMIPSRLLHYIAEVGC